MAIELKFAAKKCANTTLWVVSRLLKQRVRNYDIYKKALEGKKGLEIGGPSSIFRNTGCIPIYKAVSALDGFAFQIPEKWGGRPLKEGRTFVYSDKKEPGNQYIGDTVDLGRINTGKYDLVLVSHVLEHIANPIKALEEWLRVINNGGSILLVVPDKEFTFDRKRPTTSLGHLIDDYKNGIGEDDLTHFEEIVALTDIKLDSYIPDEKFLKERALCNYTHRNLHQHVFDADLLSGVVKYLGLDILAADTMPPHHIIVLAKKSGR